MAFFGLASAFAFAALVAVVAFFLGAASALDLEAAFAGLATAAFFLGASSFSFTTFSASGLVF